MEVYPIKIGAIIWIILLLLSIFYASKVYFEGKGKDSKEQKNSNIQLIFAILGVFITLLAIAWTEMPEIFNHRVHLPDFGAIDTADTSDETDGEFENEQINTDQYLIDGTKLSELGSRVVMSSIAYDNDTYHDSHILLVRPNNVEDWESGEVDITGNDYMWLNLHVRNDNPSEDVIAYNTSVHIEMPKDDSFSTRKTIRTCVYASNAEPTDRWDDVELYSDREFKLSYVPQSSHMYNGYFGWNYTTIPSAAKLGDMILDYPGAMVGYKSSDGKMPGGLKYQTNVAAKVNIEWK